MRGAPENLDHVDGMPDLGKRADKRPAQQALADVPGIDRDHVIAALHEIFEREITWTNVDRRGADHGDRLYALEDAADVVVRVGVVVHFLFPLRHCEERSDEAIHSAARVDMDCFAEPVIGRAFRATRWFAMTELFIPPFRFALLDEGADAFL